MNEFASGDRGQDRGRRYRGSHAKLGVFADEWVASRAAVSCFLPLEDGPTAVLPRAWMCVGCRSSWLFGA